LPDDDDDDDDDVCALCEDGAGHTSGTARRAEERRVIRTPSNPRFVHKGMICPPNLGTLRSGESTNHPISDTRAWYICLAQ